MPIHARQGYNDLDFEAVRWMFLPGCKRRQTDIASPEILSVLLKRLWHCSGLILDNAADGSSTNELPNEFRTLREAVHHLWRLQFDAMLKVSQLLRSNGIPFAFCKGAATALIAYQPGHRISGDIDIAFAKPDAIQAHCLLRSHGFIQCGFDKNSRTYVPLADDDARKQEVGHHELCMLLLQRVLPEPLALHFRAIGPLSFILEPMIQIQGDKVLYNGEIDIHHGIFSNIPCDELVGTSAPSAISDQLCVPGIEHVFVHAAMKMYLESVHAYFKGPHQFIDLSRLAEEMDDADWNAAISLFRQYNMLHAGYYICRRIAQHCAWFPARVVDILGTTASQRSGTPTELNDFGDFWDKMWWLGA